jgi:DUF438 domain-containing protein
MSESFDKESKKEVLKEIIKKLHEGANPEEVKEEFKKVLKDITPVEISQIEEELIREGMPREEMQKLCDVHLLVFREAVEREKTSMPSGHPIHTLMEEHKILLQFADTLKNIAHRIKEAKDFDSVAREIEQIKHIEKHLKDSESHYVREENVLFPYLEKHGITQPPAIMWTEHDKIRVIKKNLYRLIDMRASMTFEDFQEQLEEASISLAEMLSSHFYKENNILFPSALEVVTENEWKEIRKQFDELGYCCFTPEHAKDVAAEIKMDITEVEIGDKILFETGEMLKEELKAVLNTLPVDITFVDKEDTVRYFSDSKDRIFPRTKAIIGRKVQQCHPQKSVHIVEQILDDFKNDRKTKAEFWIPLNERLIYIRYFALHDKNGDYLGCLEVTQDITDIKKIEGERRLL